MGATGGSVEEISCAGRSFTPAADSDANFNIGGFTVDNPANGNGTARMVKTRVGWAFGPVALSIDNANNDLEFLQDVADRNDFVVCSFTLADGTVWQGMGCPKGDIQMSTQSTTAPITFGGPQKLTQQ